MPHRQITECIAIEAGSSGFDLVHAGALSTYNDRVEPQWQLPVPTDSSLSDHLVVIVGNTRRLWPTFQKQLTQTAPLVAHPLDRWTVDILGPAFARAAALLGVSEPVVRYAFEPPPRRIAMQRLAHLTGMAHLGPAHLLVHPQYGPWFALRAAAVYSVAPPSPAAPAPNPCEGCPGRPCTAALNNAIARGAEATWHDWLKLRDACPQGTAHRYSDEQCHYHYAKAPFTDDE